jgi:hypothetical protein
VFLLVDVLAFLLDVLMVQKLVISLVV